MLSAYNENSLGWDAHGQYSNWLGLSQTVTVAHLLRMNRPIASTTKKGKAKKAGYSQRAIKPPQPYSLGGKLAKGTKYKLFPDSMIVGIPNDSNPKQKNNMQIFQDGKNEAIAESSRRYMAALGIFIKRGTVLKSPKRLLIDPIQNKYPPDKLFETAFTDILLGKLKVRE
jgi:hypothetical protein